MKKCTFESLVIKILPNCLLEYQCHHTILQESFIHYWTFYESALSMYSLIMEYYKLFGNALKI